MVDTTCTSLTVNWPQSTGNLDFYRVCYSPPDGTTPDCSDIQVGANRALRIENLLDNSQYRVTIKAVSGSDDTRTESVERTQTFSTRK